jgi:inosose dehydratase
MSPAARIGTAPVNWGVDPDYTWCPQPGAEEVLERTVRAGYAATEFAYNFPRALDQLAEMLQRHGLALTAAFSPLDLLSDESMQANMAEARWRLGMLQRVGGTALLLADSGSPERVANAGRIAGRPDLRLPEEGWQRLAAAAERLGEEARALGLWVAYHHHAGTFVETTEEIDELMRRTSPERVGLCLDSGHAVHGGADPVDLARRYGARVRHFHVKDIDPEVLAGVRSGAVSGNDAVRQGIYCRLGAGCVDVGAVAEQLRRHGYGGWWVVEQDAAPDPDQAAVANRIYLERLLA